MREDDAGAVEHREPALDARKARKRAVGIDVGDADAHQPAIAARPDQQRARLAAAVAPRLGGDVGDADGAAGGHAVLYNRGARGSPLSGRTRA